MKEYEVALTYLNGCAGEAYPQVSLEEAETASPEDYIRNKHGKQASAFIRELREDGREVYTFSNGAVTYIYEFTEL